MIETTKVVLHLEKNPTPPASPERLHKCPKMGSINSYLRVSLYGADQNFPTFGHSEAFEKSPKKRVFWTPYVLCTTRVYTAYMLSYVRKYTKCIIKRPQFVATKRACKKRMGLGWPKRADGVGEWDGHNTTCCINSVRVCVW
jgi:hypothetical protein